jgi:hypothetical protein
LAHLFYSFPICSRPILVICGLLPGENYLTGGCHGDSKPANFSSPVCSTTGDAGKNVETGFMRWSPVCHRKHWVAKGKISILCIKGEFFTSPFKGLIR